MRGNLLAILVHAADIQDRDALVALLDQFAHRFPRLVVILADTAYRADWRTDLEREYGIEIRIVEKPAERVDRDHEGELWLAFDSAEHGH